jgi:hypothetical protein
MKLLNNIFFFNKKQKYKEYYFDLICKAIFMIFSKNWWLNENYNR